MLEKYFGFDYGDEDDDEESEESENNDFLHINDGGDEDGPLTKNHSEAKEVNKLYLLEPIKKTKKIRKSQMMANELQKSRMDQFEPNQQRNSYRHSDFDDEALPHRPYSTFMLDEDDSNGHLIYGNKAFERATMNETTNNQNDYNTFNQ